MLDPNEILICIKMTDLHCVPKTTVSYQKHAARSKIDQFPKNFHWMLDDITNALTFVSKS